MVFLGSTSFQTPSLEISTDPLPLKKNVLDQSSAISSHWSFQSSSSLSESESWRKDVQDYWWLENLRLNTRSISTCEKPPPSIWHLINFRWSFPRRSSPSFPIVHHVPSMRIQELRIPPVERTWKNRETGGVTHRIWGTPVSDKAIWTSY